MFIEQHIEGIVPYKLIHINGELAESYNHALKKLVGKMTSCKSFSIDKRGYSPEIEAEIGPNYLQNTPAHRYIIIVTPSQQQADLMYDEFSFDNTVIDYVYRNYSSIISTVTRIDCLFGELNDGVSHFQGIEDCVLLSRVNVELDTPSPFLANAKKLQELVDALRQNPELLIENYAHHPLKILELVEEVGDIRRYNFSDLSITLEVESFYSQLFDGIYLFRSIPGTTFYPIRDPYNLPKRKLHGGHERVKLANGKSRTKTVIIYNTDSEPAPLNDIEYIHITKKSKIILFLLHNKLAELNYSLIEKRICELEDYVLLKEGHDIIEMPEPKRHMLLSQYEVTMPAVYKKLIVAKREYQAGDAGSISPEIQSFLLQPLETQGNAYEVLEKLLCHWWKYDIKTCLKYSKHNIAKHFSHADPEFRENIKKYCIQLQETN